MFQIFIFKGKTKYPTKGKTTKFSTTLGRLSKGKLDKNHQWVFSQMELSKDKVQKTRVF